MSDIHINASIYKHASVFAYLHLDLHTSKYGVPKVSIIHIGIISSAVFISTRVKLCACANIIRDLSPHT